MLCSIINICLLYVVIGVACFMDKFNIIPCIMPIKFEQVSYYRVHLLKYF